MNRFRTIATLAALGLSLAACETSGPNFGGGGIAPQVTPAGIDGNWVDANGITSSFNSGVFITRTTDTNEKLAEGSYRYQSPRLVEIEMRSLVRGTVSKVNCAMVSQNQLNCTSSAGAQFSLQRRA
ncbi:outer membrane lipoprotein Omp10 [Paenochrobactrum sp. BZR 588]|uniref:outer membrane lipoprotein Omp10 n=1 Tax=Paenochrobactrum TaxID=999488 RepID=UPI0035BBB824